MTVAACSRLMSRTSRDRRKADTVQHGEASAAQLDLYRPAGAADASDKRGVLPVDLSEDGKVEELSGGYADPAELQRRDVPGDQLGGDGVQSVLLGLVGQHQPVLGLGLQGLHRNVQAQVRAVLLDGESGAQRRVGQRLLQAPDL